MKKLLFVLLLLILPCISGAQVTYSGVTVFSITTTSDPNPELTVSAGCIFAGVSLDQATKAGLLTLVQDSVTGSINTTSQYYNALTQQAIILVPPQTFTLPREGLTMEQYQTNYLRYLERRYKVYAHQIYKQYFAIPKSSTPIN